MEELEPVSQYELDERRQRDQIGKRTEALAIIVFIILFTAFLMIIFITPDFITKANAGAMRRMEELQTQQDWYMR